MAKVKSLAGRAMHAGRVVLHDPNVDRAGKSLAAVLVVRGAIALGASAATVEIVKQALVALGVS